MFSGATSLCLYIDVETNFRIGINIKILGHYTVSSERDGDKPKCGQLAAGTGFVT